MLAQARQRAISSPYVVVEAEQFEKSWPTMSRPVALSCSDGQTYVVKYLGVPGVDMSHALVTEHVAGRLGPLLGCPIPPCALVNIPAALTALEPQLAHVVPGPSHGLRYMRDCGEREVIGAPRTDQNRASYGPLALLYGWFHASDHQIISSTADQSIYSVDHGLFLPGSHNWTSATLATAGPPVPEPLFAQHCRTDQIEDASAKLASISNEMIADAMSSVPVEWGVADSDLTALGEYLSQRRDILTSAIPSTKGP